MEPRQHKFTPAQVRSSVFMIAALLWLTVSTPFVYAARQVLAQTEHKQFSDNNSFSNTTEEKNERGVNTLSEYLHDAHLMERGFSFIENTYSRHATDLYVEYHPELISPPPEA